MRRRQGRGSPGGPADWTRRQFLARAGAAGPLPVYTAPARPAAPQKPEVHEWVPAQNL
jgi:hypothetical protein